MSKLAFLFEHKFIISLAVASVVSVYAWKAIPPPDDTRKQSPGGVALRLFFVTFLSIYLLSYLLEHFESRKSEGSLLKSGGGSSIGNQKLQEPSLRQALKHVDHGSPTF